MLFPGVGRVGHAARDRLVDGYGLSVVGVENDPLKVAALREQGTRVIKGGATDAAFRDRCTNDDEGEIIVMTTPFHGSDLIAQGGDVAFHIDEDTGVGPADGAAEAAGVGR